MSGLRDDNKRLNQTVSDLRTDRKTQDRKLRDLQHQLDEIRARSDTSARRDASALASVPELPVEVIAPARTAPVVPVVPMVHDGPRVVGVADDGTEIVYEGDAVLARPTTITHDALPSDEAAPARRRAAPARELAEVPATSDRLEVTRRIPPIAARAAIRTPKPREPQPMAAAPSGAAGDDYRAAVELVRGGQYGDALLGLRAFITKYPRHEYADNAQYWIGEAFYAQKSYAEALSEFRKVIEVYPRGNKVPDALLKLGYCYQALGQGEKARAVMVQVVNLYPTSEPATLATKRLENP